MLARVILSRWVALSIGWWRVKPAVREAHPGSVVFVHPVLRAILQSLPDFSRSRCNNRLDGQSRTFGCRAISWLRGGLILRAERARGRS
jgi:hypothetical protein